MGAAFLEVLHDLWIFAFGKRQVPSSYYERAAIGSAAVVQKPELSLDVPAITSQMVEGRIAYVLGRDVRCYQLPEISFDAALGVLPYAEAVKVDVIEGMFAHVYAKHCTGWVETKYLTDDKQMIMPHFKPAFVYTANSDETVKLRRYIDDEFLAGELELPLQPTEYVHFRVSSEMHTFSWPQVRPREVGRWQGILRGQPGVRMSIEPKTGSVLEYSGAEGRSFLAYVDSVKPDQSIVISSVGRLKDGEFLHEEVLPEKWREWRPVFISFS